MARIIKAITRNLYDRNIKTAWMQGYGEPDHEFEQFYDVINSDDEDERFAAISGLGRWSQKEFGSNVPFDSIYAQAAVTITPFTYANGFTIEQETVEDDKHGLLGKQLAGSLAQGGRETLEFLAAVPFNNATSVNYAAPWQTSGSGDGKALLATDHTVAVGGTYANTPAVQVDLSVAALQAARSALAKMVNARGLQWKMDAKTLAVAEDSRWLMMEVLSDKVPYTADQLNNYAAQNIKGVVWSRLTDPDAWFLLSNKSTKIGDKGHMAKCIMRISPEFDKTNEFLSGDRQYKGRMRVGFGVVDPRGIYGSTGG